MSKFLVAFSAAALAANAATLTATKDTAVTKDTEVTADVTIAAGDYIYLSGDGKSAPVIRTVKREETGVVGKKIRVGRYFCYTTAENAFKCKRGTEHFVLTTEKCLPGRYLRPDQEGIVTVEAEIAKGDKVTLPEEEAALRQLTGAPEDGNPSTKAIMTEEERAEFELKKKDKEFFEGHSVQCNGSNILMAVTKRKQKLYLPLGKSVDLKAGMYESMQASLGRNGSTLTMEKQHIPVTVKAVIGMRIGMTGNTMLAENTFGDAKDFAANKEFGAVFKKSTGSCTAGKYPLFNDKANKERGFLVIKEDLKEGEVLEETDLTEEQKNMKYRAVSKFFTAKNARTFGQTTITCAGTNTLAATGYSAEEQETYDNGEATDEWIQANRSRVVFYQCGEDCKYDPENSPTLEEQMNNIAFVAAPSSANGLGVAGGFIVKSAVLMFSALWYMGM